MKKQVNDPIARTLKILDVVRDHAPALGRGKVSAQRVDRDVNGSTSPIANLLAVIETVRRHAPPPARDWFCNAGDAFMRDGGSLEKRLGLRGGRFVRTERTGHLYRVRDAHLQAAFDVLIPSGELSKLDQFIAEIERFEKTDWPAARELPTPHAAWSELRQQLFLAFKTGLVVTLGKKRIAQIVLKNEDVETSARTGFPDMLDLLSRHDRKKRRGVT